MGVAAGPSAGGSSPRRGDANLDGVLDLSDAVTTLGSLLLGWAVPPCVDAVDANDSGAVFTLGYLFLGGTAPPLPYSECGTDSTEDELGCEGHHGCP